MKIIILALALALSACAGTFSARDRGLEIAWAIDTALIACDSAGTIWASHGGRYDRQSRPGYRLGEANPILMRTPGFGDRPSTIALVVFPAVAAAIAYGVTRLRLPQWSKWSVLGIIAGVEVFAVSSNARYVGACGLAGQRDMPTDF